MLKLKPSQKGRVKKDSWLFARFEKLILALFIFLLPCQLAYHLWPQFAYVYGLRVDYLSPAIYLTDILFLFLIPFIKVWPKKVLFLIGLLAAVNIFLARNPILSLFKWLTVFKLILVGLYFYSCRYYKIIRLALLASIIFFTFLGLGQFVFQKTLGSWFYWLGERSFNIQTPGIALVKIWGVNFLRAYSTFSHPNSFAGFMGAAAIIVYALAQKRKLLLATFLGLGLVLTFSLGAFGGLVLALILVKANRKFRLYLPAILIVLSFGFSYLSPRYFPGNESLQTRLSLAAGSVRLLSTNPFFGVGLNNSVGFMEKLQPVHNVFLLVGAETGLIGLLLVFGMLTILISKVSNRYYLLALVFVFLTGMMDHYWFTLQQNQLLLSLLIGLSLNEKPS